MQRACARADRLTAAGISGHNLSDCSGCQQHFYSMQGQLGQLHSCVSCPGADGKTCHGRGFCFDDALARQVPRVHAALTATGNGTCQCHEVHFFAATRRVAAAASTAFVQLAPREKDGRCDPCSAGAASVAGDMARNAFLESSHSLAVRDVPNALQGPSQRHLELQHVRNALQEGMSFNSSSASSAPRASSPFPTAAVVRSAQLVLWHQSRAAAPASHALAGSSPTREVPNARSAPWLHLRFQQQLLHECPAGFMAPESGSSTCIPCAGGFFSDEGSAQCQECSPGFISVPTAAIVRSAPAGYMAPKSSSSTCVPCDGGFFSTREVQNVWPVRPAKFHLQPVVHAEHVMPDSFPEMPSHVSPVLVERSRKQEAAHAKAAPQVKCPFPKVPGARAVRESFCETLQIQRSSIVKLVVWMWFLPSSLGSQLPALAFYVWLGSPVRFA